MTKKSDVHVATPGKEDRVSVRHIPQTDAERKKYAKDFREEKKYQQKVKEERFAKIEAKRKKRGGSSGGGKSINIEVTSD